MKKKIWDIYAPLYEKAMREDEKLYKFMYDRIPDVIEGKQVLEIATGPGLLAKHVAQVAQRMIATDYSDGMIREAKKGDCPPNLTFEVADAVKLPYKDKSFDVVLIANALHVMSEPEKALCEINCVLKPGEVLIAPNFIHSNTGLKRKIWSLILKIAGIKFEHQWSAEDYVRFLSDNSWKTIYTKEMPSRITLLYTECKRKNEMPV